jgi:Cys-tRNA(Pro)/Cys-tRNA(Cys) deacylase
MAKAGATPAIGVLTEAGVPYTAHTFARPATGKPAGKSARPGAAASFGEEAVAALGVEPGRVFKTLITQVDADLWVAIVPVPAQLDLKALAAAAGAKRAELADKARAERSTGYVLGGISPLGQRKQLPTVVDSSALEHATVFVSGGRRGLDLELDPADLVRLTSARTAPIARR